MADVEVCQLRCLRALEKWKISRKSWKIPGKSEEKMENHGKSQDNHGKVLFYAFFPGKSEEKH
jgi:hypothetical protein